MGDKTNGKTVARDVIEGHEVCQTRDAKWLCLNNVYDHFQRPNFYDIGGTYIDEVADFWFLYKTEIVSNLYILHLFVSNHQEGSFSVSICNSSEMTIIDRTSVIHLNSMCTMYNFDNLSQPSHSYLTTYSFSELDVELMKDKKLMISVSFNTTPAKEMQIQSNHVKSLHDFAQLITDPVGADFVIESSDGAKFDVHKFLLAARSEVFKAMLKFDTAESINNHVKIDDVGKEDLSCLIEFLYTGTIKDLENNNCFNILMLADRYDIKGLKDLAQHALARQLTTENALETLIVSDMYNSDTLKTAVFKFIKMNIGSLENSIFQEIHNIQLVRDLCKYIALKH